VQNIVIYPAKHYLTDPQVFKNTEEQIRNDLKKEYKDLLSQNKVLEASRLLKRVNYDLEMIKEVGYVNGIENYSRYFDGRNPGDPPYSLLDYFKEAYGDNFLVFIDESHMTVPQLRGMHNGDFARKKVLIDFGFRLKAAYDNRPLKFEEFFKIPKYLIYASATPDSWEVGMANEETKLKKVKDYNGIVEQLVRPTGVTDPEIIIRPAKDEVQDLIKEILKRAVIKQKVLVTTLTKKIAEDLTTYLKEKNIRASYLHSDIQTLERTDILDNLRKDEFDVLIGVNLLREGLDLPEVTLVAILDADKEGFLRSRTSLIQTMGRAARNISGEVIMYADVLTNSINQAVSEIKRRRKYQKKYNIEHNITPITIAKPIRKKIAEKKEEFLLLDRPKLQITYEFLKDIKNDSLTPYDRKKIVGKLEREMKKQAQDLNFELAIQIRDKVKELKGN
jgi:excinuclease ABC subunit B